MKNIIIILVIAVVHFVFTKFVSMITLSVVTANVNEIQMSFFGRWMMMLSKVLYFPVITLAWYPRQFFPGNLIVIPLFINSLLWALVIYAVLLLIKRIFAVR
jgi:hypothetical protein